MSAVPRGTRALALCFPERLSKAPLLPLFICRHDGTCPDSGSLTPWEPQPPPRNPGAVVGGGTGLGFWGAPTPRRAALTDRPRGCGVRTCTQGPRLLRLPEPLRARTKPSLKRKEVLVWENHLYSWVCHLPLAQRPSACGRMWDTGQAAAVRRLGLKEPSAVETGRVKRVSCPGTLGDFDHTS